MQVNSNNIVHFQHVNTTLKVFFMILISLINMNDNVTITTYYGIFTHLCNLQ